MLKAGIVGLPNVGKSTLFNALTRSHKAEAAAFPFCTINPNLGVVAVPDPRLEALAKIAKSPAVVHAAIEFVDIAGLVKGASRGEGLGNKFLSHIREVDAIIQAVRCFEDENIPHVAGAIDPVRDIETIFTELVLADLESVQSRLEKVSKDAKRGDKAAATEMEVLKKIELHLNQGKPANTLRLAPEERAAAKSVFLLSDKPTIFAANVKESDLADAIGIFNRGEQGLSSTSALHVSQVRDYTRTHHGCETVVICAQLESDLVDLSPDEASEYLRELGVTESGVGALIRGTYHLLGLRTFFTANEKEARAWTVHAGDTAPRAAGIIHTDFERGFIKAETVAFDDLTRCGSLAAAREHGLYRVEGRDYVVQDGDVILFKFHV
ncbi:MAG: redox-regulated ATPase YchF [Verrucomicrobia bacterium]|nr:redox-regulated ATPase YchF [Verrucomicrobiota bacterium]